MCSPIKLSSPLHISWILLMCGCGHILHQGCTPKRSGYYKTISWDQAREWNPWKEVMSSAGIVNWIKDVWSKACSPQLKIFQWKIIQGAPYLGYNLQNKGFSLTHNATDATNTRQLSTFSLIVKWLKNFGVLR